MSDPLVTHSLAEAYLYIMATPCASCRQGSLRGGEAQRLETPGSDLSVAMDVTCSHCQAVRTLRFQLPHGQGERQPGQAATINPTDTPSRIIDVAQWLTLFRMIVEAAEKEANREKARHLGIEAAQCLDEALKFYAEEENALPPPEALFHDSSRRRFREHPEQFARERLVNLRAKLPTLSVMRSRTGAEKPRKPWWKRRP